MGRYYDYYSHFTGEETEARRGEVICQTATNRYHQTFILEKMLWAHRRKPPHVSINPQVTFPLRGTMG